LLPHLCPSPFSLITTDADAYIGVAMGVRDQNKWHITSCQAGKCADKSAGMHGCCVCAECAPMSAPYAVVAGVVDHCGLQLKDHPSSFGAIRECYVRQSMAPNDASVTRSSRTASRGDNTPGKQCAGATRQGVSRRYAPSALWCTGATRHQGRLLP
jgi:hypothetical protein